MARVRIKRAYEPAEPSDGYRVLVDRLWPRDLAPSPELRKWFGHEPARFEEFRRRYREELDFEEGAVAELRRHARKETVTLVVLGELLR